METITCHCVIQQLGQFWRKRENKTHLQIPFLFQKMVFSQGFSRKVENLLTSQQPGIRSMNSGLPHKQNIAQKSTVLQPKSLDFCPIQMYFCLFHQFVYSPFSSYPQKIFLQGKKVHSVLFFIQFLFGQSKSRHKKTV